MVDPIGAFPSLARAGIGVARVRVSVRVKVSVRVSVSVRASVRVRKL